MTAAERAALEDLFGGGIMEESEGGLPLIVLPEIPLPRCTPSSAMGIFVRAAYQGYPTRLYLDRPITLASGVTPATSPAVLLGRTLYAASIGQIPAELPPHQGILAHLRRYELGV